MKHLSLFTLTFQNSMLILVMHYSRIMPLTDGMRYHTSTAVLLNEVIKLGISAVVALSEIRSSLPSGASNIALLQGLISSVFENDSWKLAIPAALYTLQNSLQYVAVSNLDAATFQVTYQLKILTTAVFSVMLLGRVLSIKKWAALFMLMVGVAIVQMPQGTTEPTEDLDGTSPEKASSRVVRALIRRAGEAEMNRSVGLMAVLISCALSGLAGVVFEKILKQSASAGAKPVSLWIRNCQLSFWSLFPALFLGVIWKDGEKISKTGFFAGYNWVVWTAIGFQAAGGIIVALVIKYADNIAKNFATSISIIVSALASAYFFDFVITVTYMAGTAVVIGATYLYSLPERPPPTPVTVIDLEETTSGNDNTYQESSRAPLLSEMSDSTRPDDATPPRSASPPPDRKVRDT